MINSSSLLKTRRFLPLFLTQFLGALNDNIFKNALVIYIAYSGIVNADNSEVMVTLVALIFILPFFLFSALAGQFADKCDRAKIARIVKAIEIFIMTLAVLAFYLHNVYLLYLALFLMGSQSAFFGPVKYAIIPQLMSKDEVVAANGLISGATFIAILVGTVFGGLLILVEDGILIIAALIIIAAILGFIISCSIPAGDPSAKINIDYNIFRQTSRIIAIARQKRDVFLAILGVAWFWFIGATFLGQLPNYVSKILFANNEVVTLFLTIFSLAIAIGSVICNKLLKGQASAIFAPISLLFVSIFIADLYFASLAYQPVVAKVGFLGFDGFLSSLGSHRIIVDLFFIALFCGIYVVPLYSIIQLFSTNANRSRIIAALNILDSAFMIISAIVAMIIFACGFAVIDIFLFLAIVNLAIILLVVKIIPSSGSTSLLNKVFAFLNKS